MSEQQEELLSALFDGETSEFETRRILQELDEEHKARWQRYQMINDVAHNKLQSQVLQIDVSAAVSAAIADEPAPTMVTLPKESKKDDSARNSWVKPFVGFAAAASVAFVTVFSFQQTNEPSLNNTVNPSAFVADGNVQASQLAIKPGVGLNAVSGSADLPLQQRISEINEHKRIEKQRLDYFLNQHAQQATFNNNRGLMPMARMASEEGKSQ